MSVAALLGSRPARGDDELPVSLHWEAPADSDCPSESELTAQIQALIGPAKGPREAVAATATVRRIDNAHGFRLELSTSSQGVSGKRALEGDSCRSIGDATALILAWLVDPSAMALRSLQAAPAPPAAPAPKPRPAPAPPQTPRKTATAAKRTSVPRFSIMLGGAGDAGTLPNLALGLGSSFRYQASSLLGVRAHASYFPHSVGTAQSPALGGTFSLVALGAGLCLSGRFAFALCVSPELDSMHAESFGAQVNGSGTHTWVSLTLDGEERARLTSRIALVARAGLVAHSQRQEFVIDGVGPVHRPGAVAGRATLGLAADF